MVRQRRALEETAERRRLEEAGIIILSNDGKEMPVQTAPTHIGDIGQGCSKDNGAQEGDRHSGDDDDGDDGDYTAFYHHLGMKLARGGGGSIVLYVFMYFL
ncbi:hypothetical protein D1007_58688 [Hordeum vulgare]|nr:hypothetical protein D1007_58688 [Hordeum vulgare]